MKSINSMMQNHNGPEASKQTPIAVPTPTPIAKNKNSSVSTTKSTSKPTPAPGTAVKTVSKTAKPTSAPLTAANAIPKMAATKPTSAPTPTANVTMTKNARIPASSSTTSTTTKASPVTATNTGTTAVAQSVKLIVPRIKIPARTSNQPFKVPLPVNRTPVDEFDMSSRRSRRAPITTITDEQLDAFEQANDGTTPLADEGQSTGIPTGEDKDFYTDEDSGAGNEDEITRTDEDGILHPDEDGAACYNSVGDGDEDEIMQVGGEDGSLEADEDGATANYGLGGEVEDNAFDTGDEDGAATHRDEDNEDSRTHKDGTQDALEDSLAPNDEDALADSPSTDLDLLALALELEDGLNNATYVPKFYFFKFITLLNKQLRDLFARNWARKHNSSTEAGKKAWLKLSKSDKQVYFSSTLIHSLIFIRFLA